MSVGQKVQVDAKLMEKILPYEHVTPKQFFEELWARLEMLPKDHQIEKEILKLAEDDASFLSLDDGSLAQTLDAVATRFAACWPHDTPLNSPEAIALIGGARARDGRLQKLSDRLTPKRTSERDFWRHYFSRVHALLASTFPSSGDKVACHLASLPVPKPDAERRFPAAATLQSEGKVDRKLMKTFVQAANKMMSSEETMLLAAKKGADEGADISRLLLEYQVELMESMGIERKFGCMTMSPDYVRKAYPDDEEIYGLLSTFMGTCNQAGRIALQQAAARAKADLSTRRIQPAAELQSEGELPIAKLIGIIEQVTKHVAGNEDVKAALMEEVKAGAPPQVTLVRWQREFLEHCGLQQDFGISLIKSVPAAAQKAALAGKGPDCAEARALQALTVMNESINNLGRDASIEARKPTLAEIERRRFRPANADNGPALLTEGKVPREMLLRFCTEVYKVLISEESISQLASTPPEKMGELSIAWQREYLEHVGIEQDHGCRELSDIPRRFQEDREMLKAFQAFQTACMIAMKKAVMVRAERQQAESEAKEVNGTS
mmetsp:Transcript_10035/g.25995  ORF Transcript_10035/g.25995 Transcript_10035/m.25995 type:complete len:551 (+) Transcript_10035:56-1708(+)